MNLYFLGGGNMADAIISGLYKNNLFNIFVADRNQEKLFLLKQKYSVSIIEIFPNINHEDILFLAVKPQDLKIALKSIDFKNKPLIISIVAGICLKSIYNLTKNSRIIRTMPNLPLKVLNGVTGLYADNFSVTEEDKSIASIIFSSAGKVFWVKNEEFLDSITSISGIWPGCIFYLMNKVFQEACNLGFSEEVAKSLVLETFVGSINLAQQSELDFKQLQDKVTSKGGVTQCALNVFNQFRLPDIIHESIKFSLKRSKEISKDLG